MKRENYDDFQNVVNSMISLLSCSFNDMTMNDFSDLRTICEHCVEEWEYLNKDIEHLFNEQE